MDLLLELLLMLLLLLLYVPYHVDTGVEARSAPPYVDKCEKGRLGFPFFFVFVFFLDVSFIHQQIKKRPPFKKCILLL